MLTNTEHVLVNIDNVYYSSCSLFLIWSLRDVFSPERHMHLKQLMQLNNP